MSITTVTPREAELMAERDDLSILLQQALDERDHYVKERDALAESDKRLRDELGNLQVGFEYYRSQCAHLSKENKVLSDVCDEALLDLKALQ